MKLVAVFFILLVAVYSAAACSQAPAGAAVLNIFNEIVSEVKTIETDVVKLLEEIV